MRPLDAVFLALAVDDFDRRTWRWWLASLTPLIAYAVQLSVVDRYQLPLTALIAVALAGRSAAVALLLAAPAFGGWFDVTRTALLWLAVAQALPRIDQRLQEVELPSRLRGFPVRLACIAVLYFTLLPLTYL